MRASHGLLTGGTAAWLRGINRRVEIAKSMAAVRSEREVSMPRLVDTADRKAVWAVATAAGEAFMSAASGEINDEFYVVHCDAERFYLAWLRSGGFGIPRSEMPADYKYSHAVRGFEHGEENPVPLAHVVASVQNGKDRVGFINGVTRTYWLLANRATSFPVAVHGAGTAQTLHRIAGLGPGPLPFTDIFSQDAAPRPR